MNGETPQTGHATSDPTYIQSGAVACGWQARFLLAVAVVAVALAGPSAASAATYTVLNLNDQGPGSLRQAILDANAHPGTDTIIWAPGLSGTIVLTGGVITISDNVKIKGPGASVLTIAEGRTVQQGEGDPSNVRVFKIGSGVSVTVTAVTIAGTGTPYASSYSGGIENAGTLTVKDSTFRSNSSITGGAILNLGASTIQGSVFSGNFNGPGDAGGGAIWNSGTIVIRASTFVGNRSDYGGAIKNTGTGTVQTSTFSGDFADVSGGAIEDFGSLTIANCTFVGNTARYAASALAGTSSTEVSNSTIAGNTVLLDIPGAVTGALVSNSILANNYGELHFYPPDGLPENCGGLVVDGGNNISFPSSDATCPSGFGSGDPTLGPLENNGGPTQTMALLPGSAAINAGNETICTADPVGGVDQRGVARPQGFQCDIGAFEAPGVKLIGDRTIEPSLDNNPAGLAEAFAFSAHGGTLNALNIYLDPTSTASSVAVGLYTNNSGHPGTLLTQATIASPVSGAWNGINVPPVRLTDGTKYWLGLLGIGGTVRFRDNCCGATGSRNSETSKQTNLTSLPARWGTGTRYHLDGPATFFGTGQP